jgi:acetyl-CoA synthetase
MNEADDEAIIVWRPQDHDVREAHLTQVLADNDAASYADLLGRIAEDTSTFEQYYERLLARVDLTWTRPWTKLMDTSRGLPFTRWFVGAGFNAAQNCLDHWIERGAGEREALVWEDEAGNSATLTFRELHDEVRALAAALLRLGVSRGDCVGIWLPMVPQAAIALLAIGYIGAVAVPAFSGYGPEALASRFNDAGARVVLATDSFERRGKTVETLQTLRDCLDLAPKIVDVLLIRRRVDARNDFSGLSARIHDWREACALAASDDVVCCDTAADEPYLLLYTSGSTGKPKGVVHPHAGFAVKAALDQYLCFDLRPADRMLWYTDMGWMMGPWLVLGALMLGATVVMYDGTPDYPAPDRLWEVCAKRRVTHLGVAPTAIRALAVHGAAYPAKHDLSSIRILGSTGEPWNTKPYCWFAEHVGGGRAPIINYSGGTEIGGGILGCFPTMPLGPNAFHGPIPGMRADIVDVDGQPLNAGVGELILRASWPGMTQSLWGGNVCERDDARYVSAYWRRFDQLWTHGDWAEKRRVESDGAHQEFWYIRGRSDDTINVAGKRVGPAEFESALVGDPAVREAAAIGVPDEIKGDVVICFVCVRAGFEESESLRNGLKKRIEHALGHALLPKKILFVDELPRTRNGKILRRILRARYLKLADLGDLSGLDNSSAIKAVDQNR